MVSAKNDSIRAEEARQSSQHVLFVEGRGEDAVDPTALRALLANRRIGIAPLGASFSVHSVAQALLPHHPTYYFLIDRDHHDDDFVNACWQNFPDPSKHNLLVWRKRELENYFLDPEYLSLSAYCQVGTEDLMKRILRFSRTRLFLDVANATITSIREELKTNWIEHFSDPSAFRSGEAALNRLLASAEFERHRQTVDKALSPAEIGARFHRHLEKMTGGRDAIQFGEGNWLDMIRGKPVLAQLVNSNCFRVEAADGTLLRGAEKTNEVVKDLLKQDIARQPKDFRQLKDLVSDRIGS